MPIFSTTTPLARWLAARRAGALGWLEPLSLATLFGFLLWKTWLRWPDPMVDFPRYLYLPWRMSQGALLYRDLAFFYGPLPLLVQTEAFRLFGPGLDVIIWLNLAVTAGILVLLRGIFRALGDRLSGWLCGVVFVAVFALPMPFYPETIRSLYNYITPYSCEATWGLGGVLLLVYALLRHAATGRRRWLFMAGLGLGIAYLDKIELLLAALGTWGLYLGLALLQNWRRTRAEGELKTSLVQFAGWLGWTPAGFLAAYLPVLFVLVRAGGWAYGFRSANWTLRVVLDPAYTRATSTYFQDKMLGFDHPWTNLLSHLEWGLVLIGFCAVAMWAGRSWQRAQKSGESGQGFVVLMVALSFLVVLLTHWLEIGRALLVPTMLAFVLAVGWSLRRAWRGQAGTARWPGLAVVATAALLLLARMLLNVRIYNYGFFLSVLAALLLVHLLVYELPLRFGRETKPNGLLQITLAFLVLVGAARLGQLSLANYEHRTFAVGTGRDRFYSYTPDINGDGAMVDIITSVMAQHFAQVKTVIAFPESAAVNYHLRKPDPVADFQFTPDVLKMDGVDHILAALAAHPPETVVFYARDMTEYNIPYFGADDPSGKAIVAWVESNYRLAYIYGQTTFSPTGHDIDIFIRRDPAARP